MSSTSVRSTRDIARDLNTQWDKMTTNPPANEDAALKSVQALLHSTEEFGNAAFSEAGGTGKLKYTPNSTNGTVTPAEAVHQIGESNSSTLINRAAVTSTALREHMLNSFLNVDNIREALVHIASLNTLRARIGSGELSPQLGWNAEQLPQLKKVMAPLFEVTEPMTESSGRAAGMAVAVHAATAGDGRVQQQKQM